MAKDNERATVKTEKGPKDLISLKSNRNGEIYKFACRTCIDGHRAPLCDPKKHRGKVLFRRPHPGRPARQCGHPKSANCDCQVKRSLCCTLTSDQWDRVERGEIVSVDMYDDRTQLDAAERKAESRDVPPVFDPVPQNPADPHGALLMQQSFQMPLRQPSVPRLQMFGVGGPHGDHLTQTTDPFVWTGQAPQMQQIPGDMSGVSDYKLPPQYQQANESFSSPALPQVYHTPRGSISQQQQQPPAMLPTWQMPRSEYMNYYTPQYSDGQNPPFIGLNATQIDNGRSTDFFPVYPTQQAAVPGPLPPNAPVNYGFSSFVPQPHITNMAQYSMDLDRQAQAASVPAKEPTEHCCSSRLKQPAPSFSSQNWQIPTSAPRFQFPCAQCGSRLCRCAMCPELQQIPEQNGAWGRACGRGSHLDAGAFTIPAPPAPHVQPLPVTTQAVQQGPQLPTPGGSISPQSSSVDNMTTPQSETSGQFQDIHDPRYGFVDPSILQDMDWPPQSTG